MKVAIEQDSKIIWYRDEDNKEGLASAGYIKDLMQQKIISALESALVQAKAELSEQAVIRKAGFNINCDSDDAVFCGEIRIKSGQLINKGSVIQIEQRLDILEKQLAEITKLASCMGTSMDNAILISKSVDGILTNS